MSSLRRARVTVTAATVLVGAVGLAWFYLGFERHGLTPPAGPYLSWTVVWVAGLVAALVLGHLENRQRHR